MLTLAAENQANPASATVMGSCAPPMAWSIPMLIRSASAKASRASLTSGMTVTFSPSKLGSLASLFLLCGAKYLVASCSHRSSTPSNVSRECSANRSRLVSSSTRSHSYSRKSRSRLESRVDFTRPSSPMVAVERRSVRFTWPDAESGSPGSAPTSTPSGESARTASSRIRPRSSAVLNSIAISCAVRLPCGRSQR